MKDETLAVLRHRVPGRANITLKFTGALTRPETIERIDSWINGMGGPQASPDVRDLARRRDTWQFFLWRATGEILPL